MESLIHFDSVHSRYRSRVILDACDWNWRHGDNVAICGANGAGKSVLARLICGLDRPQRGTITRSPAKANIIRLSFDTHRENIARDYKLDDSEFRDNAHDVGTTVRHYILDGTGLVAVPQAVVDLLGINHLLDSGIRFISTGETRKMMLAKALVSKPSGIIIDEPTDGLDEKSRLDIKRVLGQLFDSPVAIMVLCSDANNIPTAVRHRYYLANGKISKQSLAVAPIKFGTFPAPRQWRTTEPVAPNTLIELRDVKVSFAGKVVLSRINWRLQRGQHCHITGPNGSGKTTLLELLCGSNHAAYGQQVEIFGRQRGTGESVWDIKQLFGVVNTRMQWEYSGHLKCGDVVASGFFDSVGLFQTCSQQQIKAVEMWLKFCGLWEKRNNCFRELSFGEQRLTLIIRAMVKSPPLLILDEPFIALDTAHKALISQLLDAIAATAETSILFVSHDPTEEPSCINQWLELIPADKQGFTSKQS